MEMRCIEKTGVYIHCEECGKLVYKTRSQYNKREHHFCSNECQAAWRKKLAFEHRSCEICGEDMYVSKKSKQRFCSIKCQAEWQKGNVGVKNKKFGGGVVSCEWCGVSFPVGKYKYEKDQHHFCSKACRVSWYSKVWSQSPEWKEESRKRAVSVLSNNGVVFQTKPQVKINEILDKLGIQYRNEESFVYYSIDNYLPDYNLAIEVMGDYWHSSPRRYAESELNDKQRHIIARDKSKCTYIKKFYGIDILYLWEHDIMNNPDLCEQLIKKYVLTGGILDDYNSFNYTDEDGLLTLKKDLMVPYQKTVAAS